MNYSNRLLAAIGLSLVLIFSSSVAILIYMNSNSDKLDIGFIPKYVNTEPGGTGWYLVDINSTRPITDFDVLIQTNVSLETDYKYWPETSLLEIFAYPNSSHVDRWIEISLTFTANSLTAYDTALLNVLDWEPSNVSEAMERRDAFVAYLATNYPEFGIDNTTVWTPIYNGAGILVVDHYLFKSSHWEMAIATHVMIAPYDWVEAYIRNRTDLQPCWSGEIESWSSGNHTVVELELPTEIYRSYWIPD